MKPENKFDAFLYALMWFFMAFAFGFALYHIGHVLFFH